MTGQVVPDKDHDSARVLQDITCPAWARPVTTRGRPKPQNIELYKRYKARVEDILNFHVVGRLAECRYYDMDGVTASRSRGLSRRCHLEPLGTNDRVPAVACASAGLFWHVGTI